MKTILNVMLAANGSPSEVKARINDQVQATAQSAEQAPLVAPLRDFLDKKLSGVSEDETLSVTASISMIITDPPAIVVQKREAEKEANEQRAREVAAKIADFQQQIADLTAQLEAATKKAEKVETPAPAQG